MESVDVLLGPNHAYNFLGVEMGWQRQLDQHATHTVVFLQFPHLGHEIGFRDIRWELEAAIADAHFVAGFNFQFDVKL